MDSQQPMQPHLNAVTLQALETLLWLALLVVQVGLVAVEQSAA
jgi:hypothetical protein